MQSFHLLFFNLGGRTMATIVIKDLAASNKLDRKTMVDVRGGARRSLSFNSMIHDSSRAADDDDLPTPHQHNLGDLSVILVT